MYYNILFTKKLFTSTSSIIYLDEDDKYILKKYIPYKYKKEYVECEINILRDLLPYNNNNIINIIESSYIDNTYILLFDKYGIDLFEYTADNILTVNNISTIIITLFKTLSFLNSLNIAHCDIKRENILINDDGNIKLCDFWMRYLYVRYI